MPFSSKNNSGTRLNIQMTRLDQEISRINTESWINPESQVNPENRFNPDIRINLDSQINYPIRINSPTRPTFKTPLTLPTENTPPTLPAEVHHQNIQMTQPDQNVSRINPRRRINPERRFNPDSRINCLIQINSPIRPTFNIPLKWSSGQFLRSVQILRRSKLTTQQGNNFAPVGKLLRSVRSSTKIQTYTPAK